MLVTNTHHAAMVHRHLRTMNIDVYFDAVVTSIEAGYRKPRPEIFDLALAAVGPSPAEAVFAGDSYGPDYLGSTRAGIESYLVSGAAPPSGDVPAAKLLGSILDLERVLRS